MKLVCVNFASVRSVTGVKLGEGRWATSSPPPSKLHLNTRGRVDSSYMWYALLTSVVFMEPGVNSAGPRLADDIRDVPKWTLNTDYVPRPLPRPSF